MNVQEELRGYLDAEDRFSRFPGKRQKKRQGLVLQLLSSKFEIGKTYSEEQVNGILNQYHTFKDPATLRRLMYGKRLLNRTLDGRSYWKI